MRGNESFKKIERARSLSWSSAVHEVSLGYGIESVAPSPKFSRSRTRQAEEEAEELERAMEGGSPVFRLGESDDDDDADDADGVDGASRPRKGRK